MLGLIVAMGLALVVSPLSSAGPATADGVNGRIAFMRLDEHDTWQVWTANPDLTAQHQITAFDPPVADNGWPSWSPSGDRIAFDSTSVDPQDPGRRVTEVFTMAADGSDRQQVTHIGSTSGAPSWSSSGEWIAFTSDGGAYPEAQGIYVVRPDGTDLHRVVALPGGPKAVWLDAPRFSPDGTMLAYTFFQGGKQTPAPWSWRGETSSLWVVSLDGSDPHQIVGPGHAVGDAAWSPDSRDLIFEQMGNHPGKLSNVVSVPSDGGGLVNLTDDAGYRGGRSQQSWVIQASFDPVYSPDGTRILFSHDDYSPTVAGCTGLQVMNADGTDRDWVDSACGVEHQVDWGTAPLE